MYIRVGRYGTIVICSINVTQIVSNPSFQESFFKFKKILIVKYEHYLKVHY